ncbi:arylalkylamine N-acetyltransferase 1 isoform X1 [Drosophila biarmipes]|uniref:arylalkylamine N-acetyltransferase 1 isoform X1 n=2 Tax=Drosophila biarmipes TaxID=125945 RepID=UPI0007E7306A|nr:arylalkylamine N-acetyltransferase 1 isoform X1 [Drosophila biarmipes]
MTKAIPTFQYIVPASQPTPGKHLQKTFTRGLAPFAFNGARPSRWGSRNLYTSASTGVHCEPYIASQGRNQQLNLVHTRRFACATDSPTMEYKMIGPEHCAQVIEHLRHNFFADEPLNKAAGLCQNGSSCAALEDHCAEAIQDRMSVMAVDVKDAGTYKIAGVVLNGILKPNDTAKALEKLDSSGDAHFRKIFEMLHKHNLKHNLFEHFDVQSMFDVRILSVDSSYRGQGIANELVKRSVAVARKNGFRLMKADATGIFSQKIFRSNGFEVFSEQPYCKYTDENGKVILPVEAPHIKMQLLYKAICGDDQDDKVPNH